MILSIIGIVLGLVAIGLIFWFRRDQEMTNDLVDSDLQGSLHGYNALMDDFTNYQIKCDRELTKLENQIEIKETSRNRQIDKLKKDLPNDIRKTIGHIEFARPRDKKRN